MLGKMGVWNHIACSNQMRGLCSIDALTNQDPAELCRSVVVFEHLDPDSWVVWDFLKIPEFGCCCTSNTSEES
jgi:hypothetical protein